MMVPEHSSSVDTDDLISELELVRELEHGEAGAYLQAASRLADRTAGSSVAPALRLKALSELGNARRISGEFTAAVSALDEVISSALELPESAERAEILGLAHVRQAIVCDLTGAIVDGISHLDRASTHYRMAGNDEGLVRADMIRGALYMRVELYEEAEAAYRRALAHYEATGQEERSSMVLTNLTLLLRYMDRTKEAVEAGRRAVSIAGDSNSLLQATALGNLAFALAEEGQVEEALELTLSTEEAILGVGDPNYAIDYRRALATLRLKNGEPAEALKLLRQALEQSEELGFDRDVTDIYGLLAEAYAAAGDFTNAYRHQKEYTDQMLAQSQRKAAAQLEVQKWRLQLEQARQETARETERRQELAAALSELDSLHEKLSARAVQLEWSSYRDALTELANRRYFDERLGDLAKRSRESGKGLALLVLDLDEFKSVNDRFGHLKGDEVLRTTARLLQANTRQTDLVARLGGEEFAVLLAGNSAAEQLKKRAEQIRQAFDTYDWTGIAPGLRVTISIGAASISEAGHNPLKLLALADERLYAAKRAGRNQVVCSEPPAD